MGGPLLPPLLDDELTEITLCGLLLQRPESSDTETAIEFLNLGAKMMILQFQISHLGQQQRTVSKNGHEIMRMMYLLLDNWATLIDRSLIWSALGLISRQGLFPIPMLDISARRTSEMKQNGSSEKIDYKS